MDIIQLKCGHCQQVMAISVAHLGQQVHCPHCQGVVQTPPPSAPSSSVDLTEPGGFPGSPTTDQAPIPRAESAPAPQVDATMAMDSAGAAAPSTPDSSSQADFTQFKPRRRFDSSVFLVIALIFLVPYSLTITVFLGILLWNKATSADPFEYLRDPVPSDKKGGPRRAQPLHTLPIAAHRKTTLGQPVKAGDLLVTPQQVVLTGKGDLKLVLRVRNTSATTAFEPMNDLYVNDKLPTKPYTFLETRSKTADPIYGAYLEYHKDPKATDDPIGYAVLGPREEITIVLETHDKYRPGHVSALAKATDGEYTWRVQLRRGFVKVDNKDVSATTVIGVDFSSKDIEREGK